MEIFHVNTISIIWHVSKWSPFTNSNHRTKQNITKQKNTMNITTMGTKPWNSFLWQWTQICMLSNNDILSHVTASELFPVTLGNATHSFPPFLPLAKFSLSRSVFEKVISVWVVYILGLWVNRSFWPFGFYGQFISWKRLMVLILLTCGPWATTHVPSSKKKIVYSSEDSLGRSGHTAAGPLRPRAVPHLGQRWLN